MNERKKPSGTTATDADAAMPHERDERSAPAAENGQHRENRGTIEQARKDVESGVEDTERIGTPNNVPSSRDNRK